MFCPHLFFPETLRFSLGSSLHTQQDFPAFLGVSFSIVNVTITSTMLTHSNAMNRGIFSLIAYNRSNPNIYTVHRPPPFFKFKIRMRIRFRAILP